MKILAFDTANNSASVAISENNIVLAYIEELRPSMQAENIVPMIEDALRIAKLSYNDLDYLAVTTGPGSFTGIRIGLSVAKALIFSTNIKAAPISNFEIAYFRASSQVKNYSKIFIFLNAYREQLYSQVFDSNGMASDPLLINYVQALDLMNQEVGIKVCAGSGVEFIYDKIKDKEDIVILPRCSKVKALYMCWHIVNKLANKQGVSSNIEPLYIRPADAKII
ncbi:MAG: tRNA (adenosine(37)-N6)-threonylcarbamoyltransferase complex dimerization subunit type 1 TsaB [Rickettsia endosymbiont of Bryobia graminum]|nr:tRNA (adenosine(37)-N6)-threonylcarbamoyltransferase complex dimerization subunit type 1 TsaB [Rickettsia endosymbiont of Bryobia graminum]